MGIYRLGDDIPDIDPDTFIADTASVIGKVRLATGCSIWFGAVLRADNDCIILGAGSNVQENAVLHTDPGLPLQIGAHVTIGHQAMLHGCSIGDGSLIGMQAIILNRARIGKYCLVGAGAVVTEGKEFPDYSLILGAPAKVVRMLDEETLEKMADSAPGYVERGRKFKTLLTKIDK